MADRLSPDADYRGRLRRFRDGKSGLSAHTIFQLGEALRKCGIGWSTGVGALWSAGYVGEFVRNVMSLAQAPVDTLPASGWSFRDLAVFLGTYTPLFVSPNLARELFLDAQWLELERRGFAWFINQLPADWSDLEIAAPKKQRSLEFDDLLVHAAALGDSPKIPFDIRERLVYMLVFEWAIKAANPVLREGRVTSLGGLLAARPRLLLESEREAAISRGRDLRMLATKKGGITNDNPHP